MNRCGLGERHHPEIGARSCKKNEKNRRLDRAREGVARKYLANFAAFNRVHSRNEWQRVEYRTDGLVRWCNSNADAKTLQGGSGLKEGHGTSDVYSRRISIHRLCRYRNLQVYGAHVLRCNRCNCCNGVYARAHRHNPPAHA